MVYTYDELLAIITKPIENTRWGSNTRRIISLIHSINTANCSSCMLRRKIHEINTLMAPFGDSVGPIAINIPKISVDGNRISCPDCVAKHLSQSYVLQGEFYQGYTEYLPLIEAHLEEALEECPKSENLLIKTINDAKNSVIVDKTPKIPIILAIDLIPGGFGDKNDVNKPKLRGSLEITEELASVPVCICNSIYRFLKSMPTPAPDMSVLDKSEISGRLACVSEMISPYSRKLATDIRDIRLWVVRDNIKADDLIESINTIRTIIDILKNTENTPKNA